MRFSVTQLIRSASRFPFLFPKTKRHFLGSVALWSVAGLACQGQTKPWARQVADSLMALQSSDTAAATWSDQTGIQMLALDAEWYNTANGDYFRYVKRTVDSYLGAHSASPGEHASQDAAPDALLGRQLLLLYRVTLSPNYYQAATDQQQRLASLCGSNTPDGESRSCTALPFLAEYAEVFHQPQDFVAIAAEFEKWDGRIKTQKHAQGDVQGAGFFAGRTELLAALVDTVPYYTPENAGREPLIALLKSTAAAMTELPAGISPGTECLYTYALFKGVRLGLLPEHDAAIADRAWRDVVNRLVQTGNDGTVTLAAHGMDHGPRKGPSATSETGANAGTGDVRWQGELLLAATEAELAPTADLAGGETVMLDGWYNSQQRKDAAGHDEYFHYKWSDLSDSGYSLLEHMLRSYGAATDTLYAAPTANSLIKAQFYLIVSPDIPVKNPNPHYMNEKDAGEIAEWVKQGGVLILMENDPPNADVEHLNLLADRFGIHFKDVLVHHILGERVENGRIPVAAGGPLFRHPHTLYMKDTCTISVRGSATALLEDRGDILMATAKYGRGMVFAAVDPWFYNEYTDGRKKPEIYAQFDNFAGGKEVVRWLLEQHPKRENDTSTSKGREK
jgi:unsaturated rhamnogalacturonyl hydrolase